jgi:flagellar motility protein MotE (MotC chaperone)
MRQDMTAGPAEGRPAQAASGRKTVSKHPAQKPVPKKKSAKGAAVLVLVALAVTAGVCYYFNILDLKTRVVAFFISQDEQYAQAMASQQAQSDLLSQQQTEMEEQQGALDRRESELNERENAISYQEDEAADTQAAEEEKQAGLEKMAKIYEGMDSAAAAGIMGNFTDRQYVADLLAQMSEKKAAAILEALDPALAVDITMKMAPK